MNFLLEFDAYFYLVFSSGSSDLQHIFCYASFYQCWWGSACDHSSTLSMQFYCNLHITLFHNACGWCIINVDKNSLSSFYCEHFTWYWDNSQWIVKWLSDLFATCHYHVLHFIWLTCMAAFVIVITIVVGWTKYQKGRNKKSKALQRSVGTKHTLTTTACC